MQSPRPGVNEARLAFESGDPRATMKAASAALAASPRDPQLHWMLGASLLVLNRLTEARASLERADTLAPGQPGICCALASLARREGDVRQAIRHADRAIGAAPGLDLALRMKSELLHMTGDSLGACRVVDEAIARGLASASLELAFGLACASADRAAEGERRLRSLLGTPGLSPPVVATGSFRLGHLLDRLGRHDEAWAAFVDANRARARRFDITRTLASFEGIIRGWTPGAIARTPRSRLSGERFVFIVGMPRAGTSLVEQIVASHPKAYGGGELSDLILLSAGLGHSDMPGLGHVHHPEQLKQGEVDEAARAYQRMAAARGPNATRFTDKNPLNFPCIGVAQTLLPGSKVIWCRRDPLDVCVSIYMQDFEQGLPFATDLRQIAAMHRAHERVMLHWKSVYPGAVMELHHGELVDHQEEVTRELLSFIGLPWDERCLKFYESDRITVTASNDQVRRPLYKSTGRYAPYQKHLAQLRLDLGLPATP